MGIKQTKKSQVTIFVILAIIIVALIGFFFIRPIRELFIPPTIGEMVPRACIETAVKEPLNLTMLHGGKVKPELYLMYNNYTLNYLCYTNSWYKTCEMQIPFLKNEIESEISAYAGKDIASCMAQFEERLRGKGYSIKVSGSRTPEISIRPDKAVVAFNMTMTLEKDGETAVINPGMLQTEVKTNAYELIMVASSIQNYEARFGDATPETYSAFYPNLVVEKKKQDDGSKVYIIRDINTGERLQFATRSLAWPPGYYIPTMAAGA